MDLTTYRHDDIEITTGCKVPIKGWTVGVEIEQHARAQLANVANLPFIFKHVSVMPDAHAGKGCTVGSVVPTVGAIIPSCVGVDIGCFRGDTLIPLLDGSKRTLKDLSDKGEPIWVYSIGENGTIVPGRATAKMTRKNAALIKVVISGGDEIYCTPDHLFMMKNGTYKKAIELKFNDSLMPLYRKWLVRDGYETASCGFGSTRLTHVLVYKAIYGDVAKGHVIHHINHNLFDNRPENLSIITASEHSKHHRATGHVFKNKEPEFQKKRMAGIAKSNSKPARKKQMKEVGTKNIIEYMANKPEHFKKSVAGNGKRGAEFLIKFNQSPRMCPDCGVEQKNPAALYWHKKREHNHKVISVTETNEIADVYCLTVDKYHNFAIAAGVFVHNCGLIVVRTTLRKDMFPKDLAQLRAIIEAAVPHGFTKGRDEGSWGEIPAEVNIAWMELEPGYKKIIEKNPRASHKGPAFQLGTLGGGNHFLEVVYDETGQVWLLLHSGSRGVGNSMASCFIDSAKADMKRYHINLPDAELAYIPEGAPQFDPYMEAVNWCQRYALVNRELMAEAALRAIKKSKLVPKFEYGDETINCHHNYVTKENHYGKNILVTRKGAISARKGQAGVICGSMGTPSFIVSGLGCEESFTSASHGAGRRMSRTAAKQQITLKEHREATEGIECRKDSSVLDESPTAYKPILQVLEAEKSLVEPIHTLRQLLCTKG